VPQSVPPNRHP